MQSLNMLSKKELEYLRPWVCKTVIEVLGFPESIIVNAAVDCIGRSLTRQATTDQLSPYLDQKTDGFVESLYRKVLEVKSAKLFSGPSVPSATKKRPIQDIFSADNDTQDDDDAPPKKKRTSKFVEDIESDGGGVGATSDQQDIQELLAITKKQIEERKRQNQALLAQQGLVAMGLPPVGQAHNPLATSGPPGMQGIQKVLLNRPLVVQQSVSVHPLAYSRELHMTRGMSMGPSALDKAVKAAELQARIKSQLASKPDLLKGGGVASGPTPLILDAEGRTVDSSGKTVQITPRAPQFMVNIRAKQRASFKQVSEKKTPVREDKQAMGSVYHDSRMTPAVAQRSRKQFKFNEPGKYIKLAQVVRARTQLEHLQSEIASVARKTGISSATKLALIAPSMDQTEDVPEVEWWDAAILPGKSYAGMDRAVSRNEKFTEISDLVEHPITVQPPGEPNKPVGIPVMLTSKERKKLRRQRRREAEKEKQEKIQFGMIDKPEPKVRISNLMRVLGSEAVQDPTKVESHVRAQMAERQRKHEKANAERKLTPEERKAKKLKKLKEDLSCGIHVTVYRVRDMSNPANKFKVDMNAQQYHLTGCTLLYQDVNIVIVEGGPKSLKKFKRLMTHRIKWKPKGKRGAEEDDDDDSDEEGARKVTAQTCQVVWEGIVLDRAFTDWKMRYFPTENLARGHLKRHGVEHYWDLALSQAIVEQEGD